MLISQQMENAVGLYREIFGLVSFAISLCGSAIYIASIFRGQTKPHVYTHLVWGVITAIAFFAQVKDSAGPGAWATGLTAASCLFQALLALKYGEKNITATDRLALLASAVAIASWTLAEDPLLAVVLSSVINIVAFYPTCRKSWEKPWSENLAAYNIANVKLLLSMAAITHLTPVTALYVVSSFIVNVIFVAGCLWRRRAMEGKAALAS